MRRAALLLLLLAACDKPHAWPDDPIEVTGELRADGTCVVHMDGVRVLPDSTPAAIRMDVGPIRVAGPNEGWSEWELWCEPRGHSPALRLRTLQRPGHRVEAGRYVVEEDDYPDDPPRRWIGGTLYDPPVPDPPGRRARVEYLGAIEGTLVVTRADTLHPERPPTGTFRFVTLRIGRRAWF